MIDIHLLYELTIFEKYGTLSKAAEELFISQPALSRSMNKLEEELGVVLFTRSKNKISLLTEVVSTLYKGFTISSKIDDSNLLLSNLKSSIYDISIFNQEIKEEGLISFKTCSEKLYLNIDKNHPLAKKEGIYLSELNNQDILLYSEIGFWYNLVKDKAPNANFLIQHDNNTFNTLLNTTSFPSFATNKSIRIYGRNQSDFKVLIPILDKEATVDYYSVILKENYKKFSNLFEFIKNQEISRRI